MSDKPNPLKLNPLQLKTLTVLQAIADDPESTRHNEETGDVHILRLPHAHGDHFHVGSRIVLSRDATGLSNPAVWAALDRRGLVRAEFPVRLALTPDGLAYNTGLQDKILHRVDH